MSQTVSMLSAALGRVGKGARRLHRFQRPVTVVFHGVAVTTAYLLAVLLRYDFSVPTGEWNRFIKTLLLLLAIRIPLFALFRLYEGLWRYVSMRDILAILKAVSLSSLVFSAGVLVFLGRGFPKSVLLLDWVLCLALIGGVRLAFRALRERGRDGQGLRWGEGTLIVGAGDAGEMLVREIERNSGLKYKVVGFVDDDPKKHGRRIHGVEVLGTIDQLPHLVPHLWRCRSCSSPFLRRPGQRCGGSSGLVVLPRWSSRRFPALAS